MDLSDKVCVLILINFVFVLNFLNFCKIYICYVIVIVVVFWIYDLKCTIFRVRISWYDYCMLLVINCNFLL